MGLRFDPVGGGQFKQAVKQIMEAESQPLKSLEARKGREEAKMKLFQDFKSKFSGAAKSLDDISSFRRLRELKADLGDGERSVSVTVDKEKAQVGQYELEVENLAVRSAILSNGFDDPEGAFLGIGFVVMNMPDGSSKEVFIDEEHSSLRGVASKINSQPDSGITAAVVKDSSDPEAPWRLIISGKKDGDLQNISFPEFYFLDGDRDFYIDDNRGAKNAMLKMNGFSVELESNDVADFLPGVNLHLKHARPGEPFTLKITEDFQKISGKVKNFVDQMNGVLEFINVQNKVDEKSDTRTTFAGDTGLQTVEFRLRNLLHEGFGVGNPDDDDHFKIYFMSDLGIEFDKAGKLTFKEEKFTKLMEKDFESLSEILTGEFGFAYQMKTVLGGYTEPGVGFLALRERGLRSRIKEIDTQIETKTRQLERRHQNLTDQFSRLQASLGSLQRQQQYLSATMGGGGGGNLVQQLLGG